MLSEPQPSPYDLHFRLFGTPVRVHPFFWLFSAILGWPFLADFVIRDDLILGFLNLDQSPKTLSP